jgi:hypothetical protein
MYVLFTYTYILIQYHTILVLGFMLSTEQGTQEWTQEATLLLIEEKIQVFESLKIITLAGHSSYYKLIISFKNLKFRCAFPRIPTWIPTLLPFEYFNDYYDRPGKENHLKKVMKSH